MSERTLQLKGRLLFLSAYPVEKSDHPGPAYEHIDHLMLSGKIHEGKADENGYDPLARQNQHDHAGQEKEKADGVSGDKNDPGHERVPPVSRLDLLPVLNEVIGWQPGDYPRHGQQAADKSDKGKQSETFDKKQGMFSQLQGRLPFFPVQQ